MADMAACGDTPTKPVSGLNRLVCRTCNQNIVLKNHPVDLHGSKAKEEGIEKDLEKFLGLKIAWDDWFPSRICRPCHMRHDLRTGFQRKLLCKRLTGLTTERGTGSCRA